MFLCVQFLFILKLGAQNLPNGAGIDYSCELVQIITYVCLNIGNKYFLFTFIRGKNGTSDELNFFSHRLQHQLIHGQVYL